VLAALRAAPDTRDIPVIVISGDLDPDLHRRVLASGAKGFLVKPYDITDLLKAVDCSLGGGGT
jgi:CheY-like chemotaxis protein